jgi:hypothetical protein
LNFPKNLFRVYMLAMDAQFAGAEQLEHDEGLKEVQVGEAHFVGVMGGEVFEVVFEVVGEVAEEPGGLRFVKFAELGKGLGGLGEAEAAQGAGADEAFIGPVVGGVFVGIEEAAGGERSGPLESGSFPMGRIFDKLNLQS